MRPRFAAGMAVAVMLAVMLVAAACSKDSANDSPKDSTTTAASPAAQATTAAPSGPAAYTAYEYGFDGPDALPAGTSDITVENVGATGHVMEILRLDKHQDWTEEQAIEFVKNNPDVQPKWAVPVGGAFSPNGPAGSPIAPGETGTVQFWEVNEKGQPVPIEGGSLQPGTYVFMCFLGPPSHAAEGMMKKVTVS